jgi:hypothetical protein
VENADLRREAKTATQQETTTMPGGMLSKPYQTRRLALQTRETNDIDNEQCIHLDANTQGSLSSQSRYLRQKHPRVSFRLDFSAIYNCHGLTFASRRTCIASSTEIRKILAEDGFESVPAASQAEPGDIVLYVAAGDIEHSGVVIEADNLSPLVLSKWGKGPEVIHRVADCPYDATNVEYHRVTK